MTVEDVSWYEEMAAAMKKRDHAIKMATMWQDKQLKAESEIKNLQHLFTGTHTSTEQVQEY